MKYKLVLLFSFVCALSFGQTSILKLLFNGNAVDSSVHNVSGSLQGTTAYSSSIKQEGTHSFNPGYLGQWESTGELDLTSDFTVSAWFRTADAGTSTLWGNVAASSEYGVYLRVEGDGNSLLLYTKSPTGNYDFATSATGVWADNTWTQAIVQVIASIGRVRMWVNGTKLVLTDSSINTTFDWEQIFNVVGYRDGMIDFSGSYVDNVQVYDYITTNAQNDSLNDYGNTSFGLYEAGGEPEPEPQPPPSGLAHHFIDNDTVINYINDQAASGYINQPGGEEEPEGDSLVVLFANNFETFQTGPLLFDTVMKHFQVWKGNYYTAGQSILDVGGDNDKVWHSNYPEGHAGNNYGFEIHIPLNAEYDELWLDYDLRVEPGFNGNGPTAAGGKVPGGFYGGRDHVVYMDSTTGEWASAWWVHNVWGSSENLMHYRYDLLHTGYAWTYIMQLPESWVRISKRMKVNTPGYADGFIEAYVDGVFVSGEYGLKLRSAAQGEDYGKIEGARLSYFFGGGEPYFNALDDYWVEFDNVVISQVTSGTRKITGHSTAGHVISELQSADVNVDSMIYNEAFTASTGVIQSHYNVEYPPNKNTIVTKTISRPSGTINLDFEYYRYTYGGDINEYGYLNVYTGIGAGRSANPIYTFSSINRPDPGDGATHYEINDNEITLEWSVGMGYGHAKGWKLTYTSIP